MKFSLPPLAGLLLFVSLAAFLPADELDDYLRQEVRSQHIPGVVVAIKQGDQPAQFRTEGSADLENRVPPDEMTVFQVGSLTKQFTATAVMLLVQDGKLRLDDPVARHLPDLPATWSAVTIRQLLSHTSGIPDYTAQGGMQGRRRLESQPRDLLEPVRAAPLEFTPGSVHSYSNTNYVLLALLIERSAGQTYGQFLQQRIFTPLLLTATEVNDPAKIVAHRAHGYVYPAEQMQNADFFSPSNAFGAGNLLSSAGDLLRWQTALLAGKLLEPDRLAEMWTPVALAGGGTAPYGLGWSVRFFRGQHLISHAGNITGFSCASLYFPERKLIVVVLTNRGNINADQLAAGIAGKLDVSLARPPLPSAIPDPDPALTARLQRVLLEMGSGDMPAGDFNEKINRELGPLVRQNSAEAKRHAAGNGRLLSFALVGREAKTGELILQYLVDFANRGHANVYITLDAAGKISHWGVQSAD